jgi:hypothetical protein
MSSVRGTYMTLYTQSVLLRVSAARRNLSQSRVGSEPTI